MHIYIPQALDMCSDQNTGKVTIMTLCLKHIFWHHFALVNRFPQVQDICSDLSAGKVSILTACWKHIYWHHFALVSCFPRAQNFAQLCTSCFRQAQ